MLMVYEMNRAQNKKKTGMNTDTQIAYCSLAHPNVINFGNYP